MNPLTNLPDYTNHLPDNIRSQGGVLLDYLVDNNLSPKRIVASNEGLVFFFRTTVGDLEITADIEFDSSGTISASVIPLKDGDVYTDTENILDLWEVEEPAPFESTVALIKERLQL